jgi:methyltransferase OMS1
MIQQTEKKLRAKKKADVMFGVMDASRLTFKDRSFDHVVDTFGLCSFEDPGKTLQHSTRSL